MSQDHSSTTGRVSGVHAGRESLELRLRGAAGRRRAGSWCSGRSFGSEDLTFSWSVCAPFFWLRGSDVLLVGLVIGVKTLERPGPTGLEPRSRGCSGVVARGGVAGTAGRRAWAGFLGGVGFLEFRGACRVPGAGSSAGLGRRAVFGGWIQARLLGPWVGVRSRARLWPAFKRGAPAGPWSTTGRVSGVHAGRESLELRLRGGAGRRRVGSWGSGRSLGSEDLTFSWSVCAQFFWLRESDVLLGPLSTRRSGPVQRVCSAPFGAEQSCCNARAGAKGAGWPWPDFSGWVQARLLGWGLAGFKRRTEADATGRERSSCDVGWLHRGRCAAGVTPRSGNDMGQAMKKQKIRLIRPPIH